MKLYLISRTDKARYDEYDSFVVAAESEENALKFHPDNRYFEEDDYFIDGEVYKWTAKENVKIECIGESYSKEEKVIISSFNAG